MGGCVGRGMWLREGDEDQAAPPEDGAPSRWAKVPEGHRAALQLPRARSRLGARSPAVGQRRGDGHPTNCPVESCPCPLELDAEPGRVGAVSPGPPLVLPQLSGRLLPLQS